MQASQQLNSTRSFSSKLLKLSFCDHLISSPEWCIRYWLRWEKRKVICQQCGEERSCERQLVCWGRHSNYWGKPLWFKLLFYGWLLIQNQKTKPSYRYASIKSKTATKLAKTDEKEIKPSNGSKKNQDQRWWARPQRLKSQIIKSKKKLLSHAPTC